MRDLIVDVAVFAYAFGAPHREKAACIALVEAARRGDVRLHASVEMVQELVFHRMRRVDRQLAVRQAQAAKQLCFLHPFDQNVLDKALELTATTVIGRRDAVHAATALLAGFDAIVSPDRDFDAVPGLRRLDPQQALG